MERDNDGNIYVAGEFNSPWATIGGVTFYKSDTGSTGDVFIAKLNFNFSVIWIKTFGTNDAYETFQSLEVDPVSGDPYLNMICGNPPGAQILTINGMSFPQCDGVVLKLDPTTGDAVWGTAVGNFSQNSANYFTDCAVHSSGLVCVATIYSPGFTIGSVDFGLSVITGKGDCSGIVTLDPATGTVLNGTALCPGAGCNAQALNVVASQVPGVPFYVGGQGYCNLTFGGATTPAAPINNYQKPFVFAFNGDYTSQWGRYMGHLQDSNYQALLYALAMKPDGTELAVSTHFKTATVCGSETITPLGSWGLGSTTALLLRVSRQSIQALFGNNVPNSYLLSYLFV